jgi:hypothetical protein
MNLLFVSNGTLTPVYSIVAKHLESLGHNIFWIVSEDIWRRALSNNFCLESILRIDRTLDCDLSYSPKVSIPLNEIIFIDRELRSWESERSSSYIRNLHHKIKKFLLDNEIDFAFSENTWAHEIIISMMCDIDDEINCRHLSAHNLRIPDNRFAFFSNFLLYETASRDQPYEEIQASCLQKRSDIKLQDDVIVSRRNSKRHWFDKLISFVFRANYDADSPTWWGTSRLDSFRRAFMQILNAFTYKFVDKIDEEGILALAEESDLYIYAFHKEPETAINNKGRYNESQATCILNIWRKLPLGTVLLIKEHRVSIGDRGYFYFQKLLRLGSIRVIDESIDSAFIMEKCDVCFTVSGTMAYEFAINQKPAFTFSRVFFNALQYCSNLSTVDLIKGDDMNSIIKRLIFDKPGLTNEEYVAFLSRNSFSGKIGDTNNLPETIDEPNIGSLCSAFEKVLLSR